jgi:hypothetical protein
VPSTARFFQNPSRLKLGSSRCSLTSLVRRFGRGQSSDRRGANRARYGKFATLPEGVWIVPERPRPASLALNAQARYHIAGPPTSLRRERGRPVRLGPQRRCFAPARPCDSCTKFVSPMDLRSPRLVRQLPGTTTQIPTPRCGPLRCDLRSTRESTLWTGCQFATPHISHLAPFVYGMKDRQTRRIETRKGRAVGFALL